MSSVVIAGAGISGLAVAFELRKLGVTVRVLEKDARPGGKIHSDRRDGYVCERGPASFLDRGGDIAGVARGLGMQDRLLSAGDAGDRRLVVADGRLHAMPTTAAELMASPLLPPSAKARVLLDIVKPRGPSARGQEESVSAFASRRLGKMAGERLLEPLVSGLYAGDPEQVSLPAAFPLVAAMERDQRSILIAMRRELSKAMHPGAARLASFVTGLDELTAGLARSLGVDLVLGADVRSIDKIPGAYRVVVEENRILQTLETQAIVLAVPAYVATELVATLDAGLVEPLARIPYVPVALAHLGYPSSALPRSMNAYGFFVPPSESVRILGGIFASQLFPGRAPPGHELFTVRMAGARHPDDLRLDDAELARLAHADLQRLLGLTVEPSFVHIVRHEHALPQYTMGHKARVAAVVEGERRHPGLFFHGNAYHNAGVPELVSRSAKLAARIATFVRGAARGTI